MQQADRNRLSAGLLCEAADASQRRFIQWRRDRAVKIRASADAEPQIARYQRFRPRWSQRVQLGAVLPADFDKVFESGIDNEANLCSFHLEQRISGDG